MRAALPLLAAAVLATAGCGGTDSPDGLSRDERQQLNDAAAMLDANSVALGDQEDGQEDGQENGGNQ